MEELESRTHLAVGLVAAYGFNEGSGATVIDASGNGNNGTITNATWTTAGKYGSALSFNGTNSWVTINDSPSLDLTNGMTLEAWVSSKSLTNKQDVLMKERPSGLSYALYATNNSSKPPAGYLNKGGSNVTAVGTTNLVLNTWTFLAATYNGSKLSLYVNGTLVKSTSTTGNMVTSTGALRIGGDSVFGEYFNGLIDEVRVYNRALSQAEIQTDQTTPVADTTPPSITAETPAPSATNVPITSALTATFSESVQASTIQWVVADSSNNPVFGTATYSDVTHVATFTPSSLLAANTQYNVSVSGAKDQSGNLMTAPVNWSFTTAAK